jgi:hypothetical protein
MRITTRILLGLDSDSNHNAAPESMKTTVTLTDENAAGLANL